MKKATKPTARRTPPHKRKPKHSSSQPLIRNRFLTLGLVTFVFCPVSGQNNPAHNRATDDLDHKRNNGVTIPRPLRRSELTPQSERNTPRQPDLDLPAETPPLDGFGNNKSNPTQGAAEQPFIRLTEPAYADGISAPAGSDRPNPRLISNTICVQDELIPNTRGASDFLWQWGQFLDHDIIETPSFDPPESFNITIPPDDPHFPTDSEITLNRSFYEQDHLPREQVNFITAYIDASNVYGSTEERAFALRTLDGSGQLKVTETEVGHLLPYNFTGLDNAPAPSPTFFLAGDIRANEQIGLLAMHTLFVREHNHWATQYLEENPTATGEEAYQFARLIVSSEMQAITYREFLPTLLGKNALPPYRAYNPKVDATISNEFGAAAYRLGHSMLSSTLLRLDPDGNEAPEGHLSLADAFFTPSEIEDHGIDSVLRGLANQQCQELDEKIIDDVRNFLFGPPGAGGFDLASLNIQRGRDHGLPDYNTMRIAAHMPPARSIQDINPAIADNLAAVYPSPDQVDLWIGGLCESKLPGSMVGPLLQAILVNQFRRLRDGDRFYYESHLPRHLVRLVEEQTLAHIIRRNTGISDEIPENVFLVRNPDRPQNTASRKHSQRRR
ncbi:MAG: peroxidase family protein [Verrucomicrobiota bacterium]